MRRALSLDDARKLETVMLALRRGDVAEAARHDRLFELKPIAASKHNEAMIAEA